MVVLLIPITAQFGWITMEVRSLEEKKKLFRFEEVWIGEEGCNQIIKQAWQSSCRGETIQEVMDVNNRCDESLGQWNKNYFGNVQKHLVEAQKRLQEAQSMDQRMVSIEVIREAQMDVHLWLERDEMMRR